MINTVLQGPTLEGMTAAEFGRLFSSCRARYQAIACRYVRSAAVAEDLVSDSFIAFWESRAKIAADANIQAYVLVIVRNKCLDYLRAQTLHAKIEQQVQQLQQRTFEADIRSLQAFDPEEIFSKEMTEIVQRSLDGMPELTREVFLVRRFSGMSYRDIATKYDITERRVEFELAKALKELRVALKDYLPIVYILLSYNVLES